MPRGRAGQTPHMARLDSELRILAALRVAGYKGLRFNELRRLVGVHQDTLSQRLKSLLREGKVSYSSSSGTYVISEAGLEDLGFIYLLSLMEQLGSDRSAMGGKVSGSVKQDEDAILRATVLHAIPSLPPTWMEMLLRLIHEEMLALKLMSLSQVLGIELKEFLRDPTRQKILDRLRLRSLRGKQILVCVIDYDILRERLDEVYLENMVEAGLRTLHREEPS